MSGLGLADKDIGVLLPPPSEDPEEAFGTDEERPLWDGC